MRKWIIVSVLTLLFVSACVATDKGGWPRPAEVEKAVFTHSDGTESIFDMSEGAEPTPQNTIAKGVGDVATGVATGNIVKILLGGLAIGTTLWGSRERKAKINANERAADTTDLYNTTDSELTAVINGVENFTKRSEVDDDLAAKLKLTIAAAADLLDVGYELHDDVKNVTE